MTSECRLRVVTRLDPGGATLAEVAVSLVLVPFTPAR
jgi:hypothetical protein